MWRACRSAVNPLLPPVDDYTVQNESSVDLDAPAVFVLFCSKRFAGLSGRALSGVYRIHRIGGSLGNPFEDVFVSMIETHPSISA
jgi:hypothetical protein